MSQQIFPSFSGWIWMNITRTLAVVGVNHGLRLAVRWELWHLFNFLPFQVLRIKPKMYLALVKQDWVRLLTLRPRSNTNSLDAATNNATIFFLSLNGRFKSLEMISYEQKHHEKQQSHHHFLFTKNRFKAETKRTNQQVVLYFRLYQGYSPIFGFLCNWVNYDFEHQLNSRVNES